MQGRLVKRVLRSQGKKWCKKSPVLGKGSFGTVVLVRYLGKQYAVKTMSTQKYGPFYAAVREEYCQFRHRNIVTRYDSMWHNFKWVGLYEVGTPIKDACHASVLVDILGALAFLHARGIAHRDVKPDNILCFGGVYKLIDFGLARPLVETDTAQTGYVCSRWWRPLELLQGKMTDVRCDVWSLGVVCLGLKRKTTVFYGTVEHIVQQFEKLSWERDEILYRKMVCVLDKRWTSWQLCDHLRVKYRMDVSVKLPPSKERSALLGHEVDWHHYCRRGYI